MRICILLLALLILASGCTPASDSLEPATAAPKIMPRLNPSPTPSGSTLPLTCQVTDLKVYINEMDGYCFAYPTRFTLGNQPSDKPDKTLREQADAYLKDFSVADPASFTWSQVPVGGEPAGAERTADARADVRSGLCLPCYRRAGCLHAPGFGECCWWVDRRFRPRCPGPVCARGGAGRPGLPG